MSGSARLSGFLFPRPSWNCQAPLSLKHNGEWNVVFSTQLRMSRSLPKFLHTRRIKILLLALSSGSPFKLRSQGVPCTGKRSGLLAFLPSCLLKASHALGCVLASSRSGLQSHEKPSLHGSSWEAHAITTFG